MEPLSESEIYDRTGDKIFQRGEDYWRRGAVISLVKRGNSLHAKVEGSSFQPYRVAIRWVNDSEVNATCDCPYADEWGDWCKHIVAVLLQHSNEIIDDQPSLSQVLSSLPKKELLALLDQASEYKPEIYDTLVALFNGEEPEDDDDGWREEY